MRNKKRATAQRQFREKDDSSTVADSLNDDVLEKLKAAKKELTIVEHEKEEQRQEQIRRERKEREENKSFEELLEQYGGLGPNQK